MIPKPRRGPLRKVASILYAIVRVLFMLLLVIIPIPIGALFPRGQSVYRKNQPTQVVKKTDEG